MIYRIRNNSEWALEFRSVSPVTSDMVPGTSVMASKIGFALA
jgi:hypothetical protein